MDIVRRKLMLVTIGTYRVNKLLRPPALQCVWQGESTQPILASIVVPSLGVLITQ